MQFVIWVGILNEALEKYLSVDQQVSFLEKLYSQMSFDGFDNEVRDFGMIEVNGHPLGVGVIYEIVDVEGDGLSVFSIDNPDEIIAINWEVVNIIEDLTDIEIGMDDVRIHFNPSFTV